MEFEFLSRNIFISPTINFPIDILIAHLYEPKTIGNFALTIVPWQIHDHCILNDVYVIQFEWWKELYMSRRTLDNNHYHTTLHHHITCEKLNSYNSSLFDFGDDYRFGDHYGWLYPLINGRRIYKK